MAQINQLPTRVLKAGDVFPFFSSNNGDAAKASMTALAALIAEINPTETDNEVTLFAALRGNGQTVDLSETVDKNIWLIIDSDGDYTATIKLPSADVVSDRMEVCMVINGGDISAVTMQATGATFFGDLPTAFMQKERYRIKYDAVMKTWYLISTAVQYMPANPY